MFAKKTEENDESLENRMDDIFDTPRARCLKLKTEFLRKARDYKFWGHDKSRQRVIALDNLARYCRQSIELAAWGTELRNAVDMDIKSFLLEEHVLPVPRSVHSKLATAGEYAITKAQEVSFMMAELEELRNKALTEFEKEEWSRQEEFSQDSYELRALRKKIYEEKWVDGYNDHILFDDIQEYEFRVKNLLEKYKKILGRREIGIWKKKLQDTIKYAAVEGNLGFLISGNEEERTDALSEGVKNTFKSIIVTQAKSEDPVSEKTLEVSSLVPQVQEIFQAAKLQESLVENLPEAPVNEPVDDQSSAVDMDIEIEARLLKLKFFRKAWCPAEPTDQTEPEKEIPLDVVRSSKPKRKVEVVKDVPTNSTKEETEKFNDWYLGKIGANSNTSADAFNSKVQATKVVSEQVETPIPVSGVYMDKEVDHDHTKNLSSPCTRTLFEGPTSLHSNLYMENMLVLFLAILKLINFSYPKLSYVPGVFPTKPQPYPDPSVPSSACGPILVPMERRLTRTSRQVVLSHVAKGYLSRLRDTVWEMLQRGKTSAGLRFIKVGEMLLA